MKPIVVACQSGKKGNGRPFASRKINRQRIARTGKVSVANATVRSRSHPLACWAYAQTLAGSILYSTHTSNAALMARPSSQAPLQRRVLLGFDGEDNEIADFVDDRAEAVATHTLGGFAQLLRPLARARTFVQQRLDVDRLASVPIFGRRAADQLLERRRSH